MFRQQGAASSNAAILRTLESYKKLASDPETRQFILKDDVCIQFLAYVLEDQEPQVILSSLKIMKLLIERPDNGPILSRIFGVTQALECLIARKCGSDVVRDAAKEILDCVRKEGEARKRTTNGERKESVVLGERNIESVLSKRLKSGHGGRLHSILKPGTIVAKTIVLQIQGLVTQEDRKACEDILVEVAGVISLTFDTNNKRCILRTKAELVAETLVKAISRSETMTARLVAKNEGGREVLTNSVDFVTNDKENEDDLPSYLPESESPDRSAGKSVTRMEGNRGRATSSWFDVATNFVSKSFYW